jgi:hypothetical protein
VWRCAATTCGGILPVLVIGIVRAPRRAHLACAMPPRSSPANRHPHWPRLPRREDGASSLPPPSRARPLLHCSSTRRPRRGGASRATVASSYSLREHLQHIGSGTYLLMFSCEKVGAMPSTC